MNSPTCPIYSIRVERYPRSRFWAVWRGEELIAVTVYKKGARSVAALAEELSATRFSKKAIQ